MKYELFLMQNLNLKSLLYCVSILRMNSKYIFLYSKTNQIKNLQAMGLVLAGDKKSNKKDFSKHRTYCEVNTYT